MALIGGIDQYTKLLIQSNHDDDSVDFWDSSTVGNVVTASGDTHHDTAQAVLSGSSIYFDGTGDILTVPHSTDLTVGAGDFTIEMWNRPVDSGTFQYLFCKWAFAIGDAEWIIRLSDTDYYQAIFYDGTAARVLESDSVASFGSWNHIAFVRSGDNFYLFVDGVKQIDTYATSASLNTSTTDVVVGDREDEPGYNAYGHCAELAIHKGIAKWTSNFTPPTAPYSLPFGSSGKYKLTFDSSLVDTDLPNFVTPVLLSSASGKTDFDSSPVFTALGTNSKKIAFEIGDTGVQCYGEIVSWDSTAETAHIEVKVPSVTSAADAIINFYYDSTVDDNIAYIGNTNSAPSDQVHGGRAFVSHQAQDPSGTAPQMLDSSPNAKHGTSYGSMTSGDLIDGLVGKALDYDSTDDYTNHGYDVAHNITDKLTIVAVIKPSITLDSGLSNNVGIVSRQNDPTDSEDTYSLFINTDGKLQLDTASGSIVSTKASWTSGSTYVVEATYNSTGLVGNLFVDGVKETLTVDNLDTMAGSTNNLVIAKNADSAEFFPGMVDEVIIINDIMSDAWGKAHNAALIDNLVTFSLLSSAVINALVQPYDLSLDPVIAAMVQDYHLTSPVKNALAQVWAHIIEVALKQHYGDADKIQAVLNQYYHDAPPVVQALIQKYDDMRQVTSSLVQKHNLMFKAETSLDQKWAVCGFQATAGLVQEYDLRLRDEVMAALSQYWGMFRDYQEVQAPIFWVMAEGVLLNPSEFSWTISKGSAAIECSITLPDHGQWRALSIKGTLEIHWNGVTYEYFVEEKSRTRSINEKEFVAGYFLKGLSLTAGLEAPYAKPVTKSWPKDTMASVIVTELADGLPIDWRIDDFPVRGGKFNVNNQTPLTAIKALVGTPSVEAVIQSSPDGKLIVRREFKHSPTEWQTAQPDHVIYDDGGVFSDSDDLDVMPGFNYVEITDEEEKDSTKRLEKENISATAIRVRGFSVPWQDTFPLNTSGGSNVSIVDNGIKTEAITEAVVEFVDGISSTSKPVYAVDLQGNPYPLTVVWNDDDLGSVKVDHNVNLTSAVPGNSLAKITYLTKYREWIVQDQEIASVQVFIPGEVDA